MKIKSIFIVLFLFVAIFSQSIPYWESGENYKRFDIVYLYGVRYIANKDGINSMPPQSGNDDWHRIVPLRFPLKPERQSRLYPIEHNDVRKLLLDDDFVKEVEKICNYSLDFVGRAGIFREKDIVGDVLHSSWRNFMVNDSSDWDNTDSLYWKALKNPLDELRYKIITRGYNDYKDISKSTESWIIALQWIFLVPVTPFVSEKREGAYEQILHNIGDAGVAFAHALSGSLPLGYSDLRELANEYAVKQLSDDDWSKLKKTYFTGSIYDAIAEYGKRTLETLDWARDNIPLKDNCFQELILNEDCLRELDYTYSTNSINDCYEYKTSKYMCYEQNINEFKLLVKGDKDKKDTVWGVLRNSISVGRFILVDAILADLSLLHQKIKGEPFVEPNKPHNLTAYAKDPDAVLFLHRDKKQGTKWTDTSELLIDNIFTDYQLWHEPSAHPMKYEWDFNNSGRYDYLSPNGNITFIIDIPQGMTIDSLNLRDNKEREIILKTLTDGKSFPVKVRNTCFTIAAKITDDEDSSAVVKKQLTFFNAIPIAEAEIKKGNTETPYIVKVKRSDIYSDDNYDKYYYQEGISAGGNKIKILSGFTDPKSYEEVYIDFFKKSYDPDGNASDQIISTEFGFNNNDTGSDYEWDIKGVNQYIDTTYYFLKNNEEEKIHEQRIIINNTFWLEPKDNDTIMSYLDQYFLSFVWENNSSPVTKDFPYPNIIPDKDYKVRVKIWDNEKSFLEKDTLKLPVLTPPEIKHVELSTFLQISGEIIETYKEENNPIVLYSGGDTTLMLKAEAYDPDNGKNAIDSLLGIKSYSWSIREKITGEEIDFLDDIDFSNTDLIGSLLTFNHKELRELLGTDLMALGNTYEVFLKIEDYDGDGGERIIKDGCGFAITKVGEFTLDYDENY